MRSKVKLISCSARICLCRSRALFYLSSRGVLDVNDIWSKYIECCVLLRRFSWLILVAVSTWCRTSWSTQSVPARTPRIFSERLKSCASFQKQPMTWWTLEDCRVLRWDNSHYCCSVVLLLNCTPVMTVLCKTSICSVLFINYLIRRYTMSSLVGMLLFCFWVKLPKL